MDLFVDHVDADHLPHAVIVDCTADQQIADRYAGLAGARHQHRDTQ